MSRTTAQMELLPADELPSMLSPDPNLTAETGTQLLQGDGKIYLVRGAQAFCCEDTPEGRTLLLALCGTSATEEPRNGQEALRLLLRGCDAEKAGQLVRRFRLRTPETFCMIALQDAGHSGEQLYNAVRALTPMEAGDLLTEYRPGLTVLIKQGGDLADAEEFALALLNTLEGEAALKPETGIGEIHRGIGEWPAALREALSAIRTGREFHLRSPVQVFRKQLLERLLSAIPSEKRQAFRDSLFPNGAGKTLTPENLETVEAFFASDLNLSDAARQMFIHRNTLTYRLDKIRRETGLDLRKFGDSVIFRVLMALPDESTEDPMER